MFDRDLLIQLLVRHTPYVKCAQNWVCGQLVDLRDKENLSTMDKSPAPTASVVQRFHCIGMPSPFLLSALQLVLLVDGYRAMYFSCSGKF